MPNALTLNLLAVFDERWKNFRTRYKACRAEFTDAAVHDLRVASRRMLAVLGLVKVLVPHPRMKKVRQFVKQTIENLNELRDVQVMLAEVSTSTEVLPELRAFQKFLIKREARLMQMAYKRIKQNRLAEPRKRIEWIRASLETEQMEGGAFTQRLLEAAKQAHALAEQALGRMDPLHISSIHRLRLAFKKFRYTVEMVYPLIEGFPPERFKTMHDYQGRMGDIQDAEVFLGALSRYVKKHALEGEMKNALQFRQQKLDSLVRVFLEHKDELTTFWNFAVEEENESVHHSSRHRSGGGGPKVHGRQPAPVDRKRRGQNAKDRAGLAETGSATGPDSKQPSRADDSDSGNTGG